MLALTLTCAVALAAPGFAQAPVGELVEKARVELAGGRADAAIDLLETALRRAPEREDAQRLLAAACSRHGVEAHDRGDLDLAGRRFARALELFPDDTIPAVLHEARRVLQTGGRLAVVSMAIGTETQRRGVPERLYTWMHRHFPHIVDCRPINVERWLTSAGFTISGMQAQAIWGLPVVTCVAR